LIANTGNGADIVVVSGDNATINTLKGNDQVFVEGGGAIINLGRGEDLAVVTSRDEKGAKVGGNTVHGNEGQDIILLAGTAGKNFLYGDAGNDVVIGGEGTDYIYGVSGKNILFGMGGTDYINGSSNADIMVANTTDAVVFDYETYDAIYEAWVENSDEEAAMDILGLGIADDAKDYLYTYKRSGDLIAANEVDDDFIGGGVDADDDEWIFLKK